MENASKALLMAAGILIGILILALAVTLFASSNSLTAEYDKTKKAEAIQQFNVNFTKYLGQQLTIHQVVTITNFANANNIQRVNIEGITYNYSNIQSDVNEYNNSIQKYKLKILGYSDEGYINQISFIKL